MSAAEQLDIDAPEVWDAIATLDRARNAYAQRTGKYTTHRETDVRERARKYVREMDPSVQGQNGSAKLWRAAIAIAHGFDIHPEHAVEILIDDFSPRCAPPWSVAELQHAAWRANRTHERQPRGYLLRRPSR